MTSNQRNQSKDNHSRITDEILDALLQGDDPQEVLESEDLLMDLRRRLTERILDAEMDYHLSSSDDPNSRNGHNHKTVLTSTGPMPLDTPRDRQGTFKPKLVPKYVRRLPGFNNKVLSLFAKGMSVRNIRDTVEELYGIEVSPDLISTVTDAVMDEFKSWQTRPLESTYAIVYLDAIHVKVRDAGSVANRAIYLGIGIAEDGRKEVLGLWLGEHETAKFWLSVLQDLKHRGVADILIAVVDGLTGFPEALEAAFPETTVQTCIVHLIRNSMSSASYRERKALSAALKTIYTAINADAAATALDAFEESELGQRFPDVVRRWRRSWERVIPFLAFSQELRKVIYTTNAIESLNASVRRAVQVRGHFTSVEAAKKLIYLALREATKSWGKPIPQWSKAKRELAIHFGDRFNASNGWVLPNQSGKSKPRDAK